VFSDESILPLLAIVTIPLGCRATSAEVGRLIGASSLPDEQLPLKEGKDPRKIGPNEVARMEIQPSSG
jgi:hypothetical protein